MGSILIPGQCLKGYSRTADRNSMIGGPPNLSIELDFRAAEVSGKHYLEVC